MFESLAVRLAENRLKKVGLPTGTVVRFADAETAKKPDRNKVIRKFFAGVFPKGKPRRPNGGDRWLVYALAPVPLTRDGVLDAWHAMIHHIPASDASLHVAGGWKPIMTKTVTGFAVPHGPISPRKSIITAFPSSTDTLFLRAVAERRPVQFLSESAFHPPATCNDASDCRECDESWRARQSRTPSRVSGTGCQRVNEPTISTVWAPRFALREDASEKFLY